MMKISSNLSNFHRYFLGPFLLFLPLLFSINESSFKEIELIPALIFGLAYILVFIFLYRYLWKISQVWRDEEFIYFGKSDPENKVPWSKVLSAWQTRPFRIFRFLFISYEDENGQIHWIRFIGHYEIDYIGKHHPEITRLLKRINTTK